MPEVGIPILAVTAIVLGIVSLVLGTHLVAVSVAGIGMGAFVLFLFALDA